MKTILVSGASGVVGYGILKSLKGFNKIGTTIYETSAASLFSDVVKIALPTDDKNYMDNLCDIIEDYRVDMIIPSIECDVYKWNEHRDILHEITFPLLNRPGLIDLCADKWVFYQEFKDSKYAIPTLIEGDIDILHIPYILKPRHGFGSKGIIRVEDEFDEIRVTNWSNYIIQPIIGTDDEEYTVSGFFDPDSNLIDYFPLRRKLSGGFTSEAIVEDRGFRDILSELAEIFKPIGPTNFQFRFDGDQAKLLEINPRISSATSIRAAFGYNESKMSIDYFLEGIKPKPVPKPFGRRAIRYTEDFIL